MQENLWSNVTVKSESIGMGNVRIVHKVFFLTRPTIKHTEAHLILTNPRDAFMSETDQIGLFRNQSRWSHTSDAGPVGIKNSILKTAVTSKSGFRLLNVIENDKPHASVCWRSIVTMAIISGCFWVTAQYLCKNTILPPFPYLTPRSGELIQPKFLNYLLCRNTRTMGLPGSKSFTIGVATYTRRVNLSSGV